MSSNLSIHQGKCGPCSLCNRESSRYTHPGKMDQMVYNLICGVEGNPLSNTACMCHACYKQASRNVGEENYHPRWKPKESVKEECAVLRCTEVVHRRTNIASTTHMEQILESKISSSKHEDILLCQTHYMSVYTSLHAPHPCDSCKCKPKRGEQHARHCPSPDIINSYLHVMGNELSTSTLHLSSIICHHCYRFGRIKVLAEIFVGRCCKSSLWSISNFSLEKELLQHLDTLGQKHDTYKFWQRFLLEDCLPYLALYISIRYRKWDLRVASYKEMIAVYTASWYLSKVDSLSHV